MLGRLRRQVVRRLAAGATDTMNYALLAAMSAFAYVLGAAGQDAAVKVGGEIGFVVFVALGGGVRVRAYLKDRTRA